MGYVNHFSMVYDPKSKPQGFIKYSIGSKIEYFITPKTRGSKIFRG
jgi:hypothetical protein